MVHVRCFYFVLAMEMDTSASFKYCWREHEQEKVDPFAQKKKRGVGFFFFLNKEGPQRTQSCLLITVGRLHFTNRT
jgi:hypothetical protein